MRDRLAGVRLTVVIVGVSIGLGALLDPALRAEIGRLLDIVALVPR